jgi:ABC-type nitrate/sulfonate/bicarbonate transport system permease component
MYCFHLHLVLHVCLLERNTFVLPAQGDTFWLNDQSDHARIQSSLLGVALGLALGVALGLALGVALGLRWQGCRA